MSFHTKSGCSRKVTYTVRWRDAPRDFNYTYIGLDDVCDMNVNKFGTWNVWSLDRWLRWTEIARSSRLFLWHSYTDVHPTTTHSIDEHSFISVHTINIDLEISSRSGKLHRKGKRLSYQPWSLLSQPFPVFVFLRFLLTSR
jgi:hypothetical protein